MEQIIEAHIIIKQTQRSVMMILCWFSAFCHTSHITDKKEGTRYLKKESLSLSKKKKNSFLSGSPLSNESTTQEPDNDLEPCSTLYFYLIYIVFSSVIKWLYLLVLTPVHCILPCKQVYENESRPFYLSTKMT